MPGRGPGAVHSLADPIPLQGHRRCEISSREQWASLEAAHSSVSPSGSLGLSRGPSSTPPLLPLHVGSSMLAAQREQGSAVVAPGHLGLLVGQCGETACAAGSAELRCQSQVPHLVGGGRTAVSRESKVPLRLCSRARPRCCSPEDLGRGGGEPACHVAWC